MPSSNSSRLIPSVSPFSFPSSTSSSGMSFVSSSVGSSLSVNSSSVSVPTLITSNPSAGSQLFSAPNPFTGSSFTSGFPAYSSTTFGVVSSSSACSSPAFGFPASSSSTSGSLLFGSSLISTSCSFSAPTLSTASTALPIQPSAPPSFLSFFPPSSSSLFSASPAQPFPFGSSSTYLKSNTSSASSAAFVPAAISSSLSSFSPTTSNFSLRTPSSLAFESSFGLKSPPSSNDSGSFSITASSSSSFQSSFGYKSAPSSEAGTASTAMTSSGTTMMPASLGFATSSAPSVSYTVTIPGASLPAGSTIPSFGQFLFSSQAAGSAADTPSVPVTGMTTSFAANTSTLASKSTTISSTTNSPYPFPSFSLPTKVSAPTSSSQPQSATSAAISVLAIKDGMERMQLAIKDAMERMQLEKSDLVEVGVQSDLPAHKVNQVASSEMVRSDPSEAEPCMERMQAENPDLEVGVLSAVPADTVNQAAGSEIVRTGPEGVPPLDKVVVQLETSARPVDVLAENRSTEDQPMNQSVVQSTPVDTVREFEASASFQESELNRIFSNLFVCVEGFLVPRPYVELYKKILRRYGHMATTEVLTDCPLGLMGVATEVMRLFEEMASCTKTDLSEDLLRRWDFRLSSAESLKFKVDWLRQRLEEVKSSYRHQIENADAIEVVRSSLAVTESKLTAVIARREDHLKAKQAAEAIHKAAEAALAVVNATLQQDDEEISVFESEKLDQLVKLCAVEGDFRPGITLASDLL